MPVMNLDSLLERSAIQTGYRLGTVNQAFDRVRRREDPWIALGDFLDDWRRAERDQRQGMTSEPISIQPDDPDRRWASLFAAVVDWLCWQNGLDAPAWVSATAFNLPEPWFVTEGEAMRSWQLVESPVPFRMRGIFTDASIVSRA